MISVYLKEINSFFSSLVGYVVVALFLVLLGMIMWVFPDFSILEYNFASLNQLFIIAPMVFMFLIPAVTMRSFSEEYQAGTLDLLRTKPITENQIVLAKFFANLSLVLFALIPTLLYYYTVYELGSPRGNLDTGAIIGSYIGLILLAACFVAIGLFASSLTKNQIVAFLLAAFLCFFFYWAFFYLSKLPIFYGRVDDIIQKIGIDYHYDSISRGLVDSRDIIYFITIIFTFLWACKVMITEFRVR